MGMWELKASGLGKGVGLEGFEVLGFRVQSHAKLGLKPQRVLCTVLGATSLDQNKTLSIDTLHSTIQLHRTP